MKLLDGPDGLTSEFCSRTEIVDIQRFLQIHMFLSGYNLLWEFFFFGILYIFIKFELSFLIHPLYSMELVINFIKFKFRNASYLSGRYCSKEKIRNRISTILASLMELLT